MALKCRSCSAAIDGKGIDAVRGFARCSYCGSLTELGGKGSAAAKGDGLRERPEVPMPDGWTVALAPEFILERRWIHFKYVFLLLPIAVIGFLCEKWIGITSGTKAHLFFQAVLLVPLGIGGLLFYTFVAGLLNRTTVTASGGRLRVHHHPLPWRGDLDIPSSSVKQLYCVERVKRTKNGETRTYEVRFVSAHGEQKHLLRELDDPEQALFLEQRLEKHLRIADRSIAGELPR